MLQVQVISVLLPGSQSQDKTSTLCPLLQHSSAREVIMHRLHSMHRSGTMCSIQALLPSLTGHFGLEDAYLSCRRTKKVWLPRQHCVGERRGRRAQKAFYNYA